jgi:energy-coupling factor transport system permease protein
MKIQLYLNTESIIHKINPIVKILWLIVLAIIVLLTNNLVLLSGTAIILLLLLFVSKIPFKFMIYYLAYIFFFLFFTTILIIITKENIITGILFLLKIMILLFSAILFALTTSNKEIIVALIKLKVPYEFAYSLSIAFLFLPILLKEIKEVIIAQKIRGHKLIFNIFKPKKTVMSLEPIIIPVILLLVNRSFSLSLAAEARGFNPTIYKKEKLNFKIKDFFAIIVLIIICALYIYI